MTEPVREVREITDADQYGTHFLILEFPGLAFKCRADEFGAPDIELTRETLHQFLQTTVDIAVGKGNWRDLVLLHACLQRWARYTKASIKAIERDDSDVWSSHEP
jgi:hypothetical protein